MLKSNYIPRWYPRVHLVAVAVATDNRVPYYNVGIVIYFYVKVKTTTVRRYSNPSNCIRGVGVGLKRDEAS